MECKNPTFLTCFKSKTYKINHFYQSKYYNTIREFNKQVQNYEMFL